MFFFWFSSDFMVLAFGWQSAAYAQACRYSYVCVYVCELCGRRWAANKCMMHVPFSLIILRQIDPKACAWSNLMIWGYRFISYIHTHAHTHTTSANTATQAVYIYVSCNAIQIATVPLTFFQSAVEFVFIYFPRRALQHLSIRRRRGTHRLTEKCQKLVREFFVRTSQFTLKLKNH